MELELELQNHQLEYFCMVHFARPDFLGEVKEFREQFAQPIKVRCE